MGRRLDECSTVAEAAAQVELDNILRQCERGTWEPPEKAPTPAPAAPEDETVHVTASRWWQRRRGELAANTQADYRWRLDHLLRELAHETTASVDVRRVDTFRQALVGRGLSARSVNMVLDCSRRSSTTPPTTSCWMRTPRAASAGG
jgi:hypothetical protein